jgi:hypothetical protein
VATILDSSDLSSPMVKSLTPTMTKAPAILLLLLGTSEMIYEDRTNVNRGVLDKQEPDRLPKAKPSICFQSLKQAMLKDKILI